MNNRNLQDIENSTVYDSNGEKVGSVGQVYLDDQTNEPTFITVKTGLFGTKETFVPYDAANRTADGLTVPFEKNFIKDAPNIDSDEHLSPQEEQRLFQYYRSNRDSAAATPVAGGDASTGRAADDVGRADARAAAGTTDDGSMVAREEHLRVGTEQHETGRARLRKHVVSDTETVQVPVQREELVVERESIDPSSPEARSAGRIGDSGEQEETVTLREERPVVGTETVAAEKVDVGKRTVSDTETVSGEVRREEIEVDKDGRTDTRR